MDSTETTNQFDLVEVLKLLNQNECIVTFTKVDGEKREMPCTLMEGKIPAPTTTTEDKKQRRPNPNVVSVWCTDKNEWRSFRFDNLISIKVKDV